MIRQGFSYIELVVSIVIVGISVVSVPQLISHSVNTSLYVLKNDSLFRADAQIKAIMTHLWDVKSYDSASGNRIVVDVTGGDVALGRKSLLKRQGSFEREKDRSFSPTVVNASMIGTGGALEAVDDFNGVVLSFDSSTSDYVMDFNLSTTVSYISDRGNYAQSSISYDVNTSAVLSQSTNIKLIQVDVLNKDDTPYVSLYSFVSNIGETKILHKEL